ncbi:unnamed protein product [Nyctereutes procyonoides]|uniref:(raccoon dog) hypothetical protein n=1 Tax=Nyctereutes procyonoides TaxID=34880 RepID=A0A811Y5P3_NYCPR|nr:unnamed protein product [Nyctereutes procyonoides]
MAGQPRWRTFVSQQGCGLVSNFLLFKRWDCPAPLHLYSGPSAWPPHTQTLCLSLWLDWPSEHSHPAPSHSPAASLSLAWQGDWQDTHVLRHLCSQCQGAALESCHSERGWQCLSRDQNKPCPIPHPQPKSHAPTPRVWNPARP